MTPKSRTVLLIPGIFDYGWSMRRMEQMLNEAGFSAHYIHLKYNSGWHGLEHLSEQLQRSVETLADKGHTCALVGFSMGGIVARYYLQSMGGLERVYKFIAISSPHFGSFWANFLPYKGGRQLRIGSQFLEQLNNDMESLSCTAPVSIWTKYDITILPHSSALLPIGTSYEVPVKLHRWMPSDARVIDLVNRELRSALA
ncbi:esterase/lipase family protein [Microbulbifer thermotolerans]|uniref:Lipase n=1 Tax=Microbulbifer thermotolerans TaxID=252514 RepID=F1SWC5_MICTH|nr:lipase [Microbulbifer thermotolerans]AMX03611.1 lipase [Microbulbifer thermotolerans]MCX2781025.1 lipase [Microbulbifer thermotolerans]MCX2782128.1 lipase [Microbulbifer thermotolerans]MCX2796069.1 lipase [Microbulbifer thermotolerans]MCX2801211.1 lipase [Microbulbifer thermotolerans]